MERYWTWGGRYIGVRQRDYLVAYEGKVLGRFWGREIYNQDGEYVGELGRNNRLIKDTNKIGCRRPIFSHAVRGAITRPYSDCAPYPLIYGFEDFDEES